MQGMRKVCIVAACRTPIGAFGGSLKSVMGAQLAAKHPSPPPPRGPAPGANSGCRWVLRGDSDPSDPEMSEEAHPRCLLAATVIKEVLQRSKIDPAIIGDVRFGSCMEHYDQANVARVASLLPRAGRAGMPFKLCARSNVFI